MLGLQRCQAAVCASAPKMHAREAIEKWRREWPAVEKICSETTKNFARQKLTLFIYIFLQFAVEGF